MPHQSPAGTALASALAKLADDSENPALRLWFHGELISTEVFVWLAGMPGPAGEGAPRATPAGTLAPQVFDLESGPTVLAFDSEAALAAFAGKAVDYAALPGRVLVRMLTEARPRLSLLVQGANGVAELLGPEALDWLMQTLSAPAPGAVMAQARSYGPPMLSPAVLSLLVPALERRLSGLPGLEAAALVQAVWQDGSTGHLLAVSGLPHPAWPAVSQAVAEALALSGAALDQLDVVFPAPERMKAILTAGLRLAPAPHTLATVPQPRNPPSAPGMDPARPPRLR